MRQRTHVPADTGGGGSEITEAEREDMLAIVKVLGIAR